MNQTEIPEIENSVKEPEEPVPAEASKCGDPFTGPFHARDALDIPGYSNDIAVRNVNPIPRVDGLVIFPFVAAENDYIRFLVRILLKLQLAQAARERLGTSERNSETSPNVFGGRFKRFISILLRINSKISLLL
jgi:hypothetical protein